MGIKIRYINVAGLNKEKINEIEQNLIEEENTIWLLTETHMKYDNLEINSNLENKVKMRDLKEKKGGGLMIIYKKKDFQMVSEIKGDNPDFMVIKIEKGNFIFKIILLYFSVINKRPDDENRNSAIKKGIEKEIEREEIPLLIIGDFNGHLQNLGYQREDKNGKIVREWAAKYNLVLLNEDEKCEGQKTWERGEQYSTIDMALVDEKLNKIIRKIWIDEKKEIFDLSDHNLIQINFEFEMNISQKDTKRIENKYFSTKEEDLKNYVLEVRKMIIESEEFHGMENFVKIINAAAKKKLEKTYYKNINGDKLEKPWFTEDIRKGIKERKRYNRMQRNAGDNGEREIYRELYEKQKKKVQIMIREEITKYEKNITDEIRSNKGCKDIQWAYINKLKGKRNREDEVFIYDEEGNRLERCKEIEAMNKEWNKIYRKGRNEIEHVWNEEEKKKYKKVEDNITLRKMKNARWCESRIIAEYEEINIPNTLAEHFGYEFKIEQPIYKMGKFTLEDEQLRKNLRKLKNKKACGPDNIKNEMIKILEVDQICFDRLKRCLNEEIFINSNPSWKSSITKIIKKKNKPTPKDLRPIALTDTTYKLLMNIIKEKIEDHLEKNGRQEELQAGFTKQRRIEDNIFILQACVEEARKRKKNIIAIAIDFKKAYDTVNRKELIKVLKDYKISEEIINFISNIYRKDETVMKIRRDMDIKFDIENGIRQGCTLSPTLFKMISYKIMREMGNRCEGVRYNEIKINSLFYADDGLILETSIEKAEKAIKNLREIAEEYGLEINKEKSKIIQFGIKNGVKEIDGIEVTNRIRYLGMQINDGKDIFKDHKNEMMEKAKKMERMSYGIIEKSCNRSMIGKVYWKSIALPAILFGTCVLNLNKEEIRKLQVIENNTYRKMLWAPSCTPVEVLRGEIGASSMEARVIKGKIMYYKSIKERSNEILKYIVNTLNDKNKWLKNLKMVVEQIGENLESVERKTKIEIKETVRKWDEEEWKKGIENKSSLDIYKREKWSIKEVQYNNDDLSRIIFRMRANVLDLNDRKRHRNEATNCELCGYEREDLKHMLLECVELEEERGKIWRFQRPRPSDEEELMSGVLFDKKEERNLYDMWIRRKAIMKRNNM